MMRTLSLTTILAAAITLPALAQDTSVKTAPAAAAQPAAALMLTAEQAQAWVDKPVYSSDNQKIGEVAAFARGVDNSVIEMHADIGGFLGIGETRVRLLPAQFSLQGDRIVLSQTTAAQAKDLPKVPN